MLKEISKAVETFHRIGLGSRKQGNRVIAEGKLASFVTILTELLIARYKNNWYPTSPNRGSGYRCLRINRQCIDPTIVESLKRADISIKILNGTELTVWVDPGVVSVRIGEEGSIGSEVVDEEVFRLSNKSMPPVQKQPSLSTSDEDEAYSSRSPSPAKSPERPMSVSPPLNSISSTQSYYPSSMDNSPHSIPHKVSCPPRFQRRMSPPRMMEKGMSTSIQVPSSHAGISSQGHIPSRSSYTHPRALFHSQDNNNGSFHEAHFRDGVVNATYMTRQALSMHSMQGNYLDIPAMA